MPKPEDDDRARFGAYPIVVSQPAYAPEPEQRRDAAVAFDAAMADLDEDKDGDEEPADPDPQGVWFAEKVVRWLVHRDRSELETIAHMCGVDAEWLKDKLYITASEGDPIECAGAEFGSLSVHFGERVLRWHATRDRATLEGLARACGCDADWLAREFDAAASHAAGPTPEPAPTPAPAPAPPPVARTDLYVIQRSQGRDRPPQFWACSSEHGTGWHDGTPKQAFTKSEISTTLLAIADVCGDLGDALRIRRLFLA